MKRLAILSAVAVLLCASCSKEEKKTVYSDSEGNSLTIKKGDDETKEMKFTTDKGTATFKVGDKDIPKDLGVPTYPGAKSASHGSFSMSGMDEDGSQEMTAITLTTADSVDDVAGFYKKALASKSPKIMSMDMPTGKMAAFVVDGEDGYQLTVSIFEDKEESWTKIQISKMKK